MINLCPPLFLGTVKTLEAIKSPLMSIIEMKPDSRLDFISPAKAFRFNLEGIEIILGKFNWL